MLRHHRLIPRVTLVWAAVAAALLLWHPDLGGLVHVASTSLHNLAEHPVLSMCLSVFTLADGWGEWATWVGLSVVWVFAEVNLGWRRSLAAFVTGHLVATLAVALIEATAVLTGLASVTIVGIPDDVGASYGFLALAGAGLAIGLRRSRWWLLAAPALVAISVVDVNGWTIAGHAVAISVGAVLATWCRALDHPAATPVDQPELVATGAAGPR
ncbi:MAG: rhomboid-like protein [Acidimicrobiales bacterium]